MLFSRILFVTCFVFSTSLQAMEEKDNMGEIHQPKTGKNKERIVSKPHRKLPLTKSVRRMVFRSEKEKEPAKNSEKIKILNIEKNLISQSDHIKALKEVFEKAERKIVISCPWTNKNFDQKAFLALIDTAKKNVHITLYTNIHGGLVLEKVLRNVKAPEVELIPMYSCGVYCLIKDYDVLINGSYPWLTSRERQENEKVFLSTVIMGPKAQTSILICLSALKRAGTQEKDISSVSAEAANRQDLPEDPLPRPLMPGPDGSDEDLSFLQTYGEPFCK